MNANTNTQELAKSIAEECIGVRVRMLNRIVTRMYDDALRVHGIRFAQMNILTVIALRGPIQPAQIGRILSIEKSTLSRNERLMSENNWIHRLPGEGGNTYLLEMTPEGRRLYKKAAAAWSKTQEKLEDLLGEETTAAIRLAADQARKSEDQS